MKAVDICLLNVLLSVSLQAQALHEGLDTLNNRLRAARHPKANLRIHDDRPAGRQLTATDYLLSLRGPMTYWPPRSVLADWLR